MLLLLLLLQLWLRGVLMLLWDSQHTVAVTAAATSAAAVAVAVTAAELHGIIIF